MRQYVEDLLKKFDGQRNQNDQQQDVKRDASERTGYALAELVEIVTVCASDGKECEAPHLYVKKTEQTGDGDHSHHRDQYGRRCAVFVFSEHFQRKGGKHVYQEERADAEALVEEEFRQERA